MKINSVLKHLFKTDEDFELPFEKIDESLTPNLRALRLSMSIADTLLSMGIAASDVVSMCLDVTDTYCMRKVQVEITSTLLMFSQDRGDDREPLTLIRAVTPRNTNDRQVQRVQELVRNIEQGKCTLEEAEERFEYIITHPDKYPLWLTTFGSAAISAGVGMLLTAQLVTIIIMFIAGALVATMVRLLGKQRIPSFFIQVAGAGFITFVAGFVAWMSRSEGITMISDVNPNYIVIGGIVMLVAGLAIVGAVQDAIDEFYLTANARILKVVMMTAGIVAGVLIGLFFTKKLGVWIDLKPTVAPSDQVLVRYAGAVLIAAGYALSTHSKFIGITLAGAIGCLSYFVFTALDASGFSAIAASAIAAAIAAAVAIFISRISNVPSVALVMSGIVPLVPGLSLFNGLMEVFSDSAVNSVSGDGGMALANALFIALAIAGGVSFGTLVARPIRRTLTRARNVLPSRQRGRRLQE